MRKRILWLVFVLVSVHFLKDITQDILRIQTPLDLLGNANEDLSRFPKLLRDLFVVLGYLSFFVEAFLIVAIPKVIKNKNSSLLKTIWIATAFLFVFLLSAVLLDPRFRLLFS